MSNEKSVMATLVDMLYTKGMEDAVDARETMPELAGVSIEDMAVYATIPRFEVFVHRYASDPRMQAAIDRFEHRHSGSEQVNGMDIVTMVTISLCMLLHCAVSDPEAAIKILEKLSKSGLYELTNRTLATGAVDRTKGDA